jgi:hypothetical protein
MLKVIKKFDFHQSGLLAITYLQCAEIGTHEFTFAKSNITEFADMEAVSNIKQIQGSDSSLAGIEVKKPYNRITKGW